MLVFPQNVGIQATANAFRGRIFPHFYEIGQPKKRKTEQICIFLHFPIAPSKKMHNNPPAFQPQPKGALA
jgi:hypothetical protein